MTGDQLRLIEADFTATLAAAIDGGVSSHLPQSLAGAAPSLITALSGGADSTALCLLAARFAARHNIDHTALIIDHGLRGESAAEAARVAARMADFTVPVTVLRITETPSGGGVQEWARRVRYDALTGVARQKGAILLLGHHAGDQAETVAMRLLRGSGLAGLAGMASISRLADIAVMRPMLDWSADTAPQICTHLGCDFERDPSNHDRRFERVRMRQMLAAHHSLADTKDAPLADQLTRLADLSARLCRAVDGALAAYTPPLNPAGYTLCDPHRLSSLSTGLWNRLMTQLIRQIGASAHPPSASSLAHLRDRLMAAQAATLAGCKFTPITEAGGKNTCLVTREIGRRPASMDVTAGQYVVFDKLWRITAPVAGTLRPLGVAPITPSETGVMSPELAHIRQNIPQQARIAIPVLDTLDGKRLYPQLEGKAMAMAVQSETQDGFSAEFITDNAISGRFNVGRDEGCIPVTAAF